MKTNNIYLGVLALIVSIQNIQAQQIQYTSVGDFYYEFSGDEAWISNKGREGYASTGWYTKEVCDIPETVEYQSATYRVTRINERSFEGCSNIKYVHIPNTVTYINRSAFSKCTGLQSIIIPQSVQAFNPPISSFIYYAPFFECTLLRTIFYTNEVAPQNWTATTNTYVPDLISYSSPGYSMNQAKIIEMISFDKTTFTYTGQSPTTTWSNNVEGYSVSLTMPTLKKDVGEYKDIIPVTFTKDDESFTANVVYRYTVTPSTLTVKASNVSREYGEENPAFSLSYSGFMNGENESVLLATPSVSTTATKSSDVGDYPISASGGSAKNYTFVYEPGTLTITKASLTAKVDDATKQYGTGNPAFTVSYNGLKNGETVPKWSESLTFETSATTLSEVGTYIISATGTPVNYNLSKIESGTLNITPAPLTIKANDATRKYFEVEPSFTYSCIGFVNSDKVDVLTKEPIFTTDATQTSNVGKYKITPSGAEAKNYTMSYEQGELTITKRSLTATSHSSRLYGEENPLLPIEYSGFVNNETENVIATKPIATTTAKKTSSVGEYPITVSGGEATNYDFVYEQGVLTVTKASLSAKVKDAIKTYGAQNPSFSIDYYGLKNGETVPAWTTAPTFQTEATKESGVGQYAIKAVNGIPVNYELEIADGTLSITPAPLTIKANDATRKYFEAEPSFTYSCTGFVNSDKVDVLTKEPIFTTDATQTSNVGKYKITPSGAEAKNYIMSYEQGELTITKRSLTATSHSSRLYGEENPLLPIEYSGFANNETENVIATKPIATTTAKKTSSVGEYPITVSGGNAVNYEFVYEPGLLIVTKAPLSAKVNDATKVYGSQNPSFTIDYYGLKNNESTPAWTTRPTFQTDATQASGVGAYTVKAVNGVPVNYDLVEIAAGTLNITPAPLTIKANDAIRQYYSDDPTFSYTCKGFVNGEGESVLVTAPTLSTSATHSSNVGTYEIKVGETSSPNYSISYVNGTLTITPRTLIASVGNYERIYNEENPMFEVKFDGFVGNDDEKVLISKPEAKTTAIKTSDVGTYPINVTGGSADNYTFSYTSGTLTINKAEQTISWEQDLSALSVDDQVELKAEASSGLPITYIMDQTNIAEIYSTGNKYYLDCKGEGTFQIVAVQNGDKNYYSSTKIRKIVTIGNSSGVNEMDNSQVKVQRTPYGIRIIDANIGDLICVYTLDGLLQYSIRVDSKNVDIPLKKQDVYIIKVGGKTVKLGF